MIEQTKSDTAFDDVFYQDVADDALERAAGVDHVNMFTIAFCTQEWNYCYPM